MDQGDMKRGGNELQLRLGLPPERLGNIRLLYDEKTSTLVLSSTVQRIGFVQPMLFVRHVEREGYQSITQLAVEWRRERATAMHQESTLGLSSPTILGGELFFVVNEINLAGPQGRVAGNELGIGRVGLDTMSFDVWDTREREQGNCTVTSLIGVDPAQSCLFAVAGFSVAAEANSGYRIEYAIARLFPENRSVEIVKRLQHIFY